MPGTGTNARLCLLDAQMCLLRAPMAVISGAEQQIRAPQRRETGMYAPERQQEILRLARDGGRVDVLSLADVFQVTAETIRRDLKALDRAGLVRRVHGGAIPAGRLDFEPDLAERESTAADEKDRIAHAALAELPGEGTMILDAGSTVARLAANLPLEA